MRFCAIFVLSCFVFALLSNYSLADDELRDTVADFTNDYQLRSVATGQGPKDNCGVHHYKLLSLLCPNSFKYQLERLNNQDFIDIPSKRGDNYGYDLQLLKRTDSDRAESSNLTTDENRKLSEMLLGSGEHNGSGALMSTRAVHANHNFNRVKRSMIKQCCHKACTLSELAQFC